MDYNGLTELFNNFALPTVMIIVFIIGIVMLFRYFTTKDEKHDEEMKQMTEKYYESNAKVAESNAKVAEALNNNTRVIEKLIERFK